MAPHADWRTLRTAHFRVHYVAGMEELGRRTARNAERAYEALARSLHPPRGPVDIVLSDDVDFSNGFATPIPSNRIVVYAAPPIEPGALRFTDDWNELVVTHELVHIFHLDRARGPWRLAQSVLGRAPFLFPNAYGPSWLTEGLAVWYESELTGAGRLRGSEHRMIARAAALEHRTPRLDELSLSTPRFPGGQAAYAWGSLFVEHLAGARGASALRDLVERQAVQLIPLWINRPARAAFGDPLERAWRRWTDSLERAVGEPRPPLPGWRPLLTHDLASGPPRWSGDSTLLSAGNPGRYPTTLRSVTTSGRVERGTRRWGVSPQVPLADGGVLYAQLDYRDPFRIRSDLWIEKDADRRRLTTGARLGMPDARRDGAIVAVQAVPGGTRLVRVSADGRTIVPITGGGPDENWSEPRWSPDGTRIAAVRWQFTGPQQLVVLDTTGRISRLLASDVAVVASPAWSADGRLIYFSWDGDGVTNVYSAQYLPWTLHPLIRRVTSTQTGMFFPAPSPDGRSIAGVEYTAAGYALGIAPLQRGDSVAMRFSTEGNFAVVQPDSVPMARARSGKPSADSAERYSPWRTLAPRWWLPLAESGLGDGTRLGAFTAGNDVVGRHSYAAELLVPTDGSGVVGDLSYRWAGLGQPFVDVALSQDWEYRGTFPATDDYYDIRRRSRDASLALSFLRPRVRQSASLTLAAGVEERIYETVPALAPSVAARPRDNVRPRVVAAAGWSRTDRGPWAISPEQGVTLNASALRRWTRGVAASGSHTGIASAAGYLPLDLPGFSRHVLSARVAGGATDRRTTSALEVGGTSGSVLSLFPGYVLGEGRETFGVRGFPSAALTGIRAATATAEYRAPLALPARGFRLLPLFLERTGVTLFGEAGSAWCPPDQARRFLCRWTGGGALPSDTTVALRDAWQTVASVGAELHVNLAVLSWDQPYRFRLGIAAPVRGREYARAEKLSAYMAVGLSY
ncbi:MAG TPA: hypothetical protein VEA99_07330 [Gemmatimonadaceae bacterium]|nr:hypothetical protein [Gemmatimonadaceae bacterium]